MTPPMFYLVSTQTKVHRGPFTSPVFAYEHEKIVRCDTNGWIKHTENGTCPVPRNSKVQIIFKSGKCLTVHIPDRNTYWYNLEKYRPLNDEESATLPEIQSEIEYYWEEGDEWRKGTCVLHWKGQAVVIDSEDDTATRVKAEYTRPLKTEEDKAVEDMVSVAEGRLDEYTARKLYQEGYRKD